ncbi:serine/threonine-protein kinase [Nocardia aurantia]|uniref:Serine/threonine-protein kinase PknK n=1 Tax=Nocardia aurantia TaxID=2585199 RepID=A0A7K0DPW6_9NOCA|nr:serine/threonine-protein kinase [Nocardia aurantia]MQY27805.1 Serine/threonine-protein kinase PknK [Nocardia aurantia]
MAANTAVLNTSPADNDIAAELLEAGFGAAEVVGRGAFGTVYRCREESLDRVVAVKVLTADLGADGRARFVREQRACGRFAAHPHIVQVLRVDVTAHGRPFLVMPFHARGTLDRHIRERGALPWPEVLSLGIKLAGALTTAHAAGVLHRDVNPANILITDYGEPQLADFGLARAADAFRTADGIIAGTPAYTAPEVLQGRPPAEAADLYGLGATLFTALTGHAAFARRDGETMVAQFVRIGAEGVPDLRATGVPAPLCSAIEAAMEHRPEDRPGSAREFGTMLRDIQFAAGLPVDTLIPTADPAAPQATRRQPVRPAPVATPTTRLRPPTSSHRLVARPRLIRTLRAGGPRRLALIHAPAGYGKSTLAAQWAAELAAENIPVAWLTLVPDDNNLVRCLTRLTEAVRRVQPNLAGELAQMLEEGAGEAVHQVVTTLINEIHEGGRTVAIVLDDWHRVHNPQVCEAVRFLLDNGCHHLRVIVTSRTTAGLPLGHMRVRDELVEIDETALRFDESEADRLLRDVGGVPLDGPELEHIRRTTEGWAAALQLVCLSLRGKPDPAAHLGRLAGQHGALGDYLMDDVVGELEPDLLDFLMRTAITDTVCADLAATLTERTGTQELLEEVRRRNLFLRSVDGDLRWFRYHSLFAGFLRDRLARRHPGLPERLHGLASDWFAAHDMVPEAVDHALAADRPGRALRLVLDSADALLAESRMSTFLALVDKLPPALAESDAELQLAVAWAHMPLFHHDVMRRTRCRIDTLLAARPLDAHSTDLAVEAELIRSVHALQCDRFDDLSLVARWRVQGPVRPFLADVGAAAAASLAFYRFDFDEVRRWHRRTTARPVRSGTFNVVLSDVSAAMAAFEQLDVEGAESILRGALDKALAAGLRPHAARFITAAQLAELLYYTGQFAEAGEIVPTGDELDTAIAEVLISAYGTAVRLAAVRGDRAAAEQAIADGRAVAQRLSLPRMSARMLNERIRLGLPIAADERRRLERLGPYVRQSDHLRAAAAEFEQDSVIRLLLAEQSPGPVRRAVERSETMFEQLRRQHRPRAQLQAQLLYACCLAAAGRTREAVDRVVPALSTCADLGLVRFAIDSGCPAMAAVVETLYGAPEAPGTPPRRFLQRMLEQFRAHSPH